MSALRRQGFLDTNVLVYLLDADPRKAGLAEKLLAANHTISVQVLSELTSVARRKLQFTWDEIADVVETIQGYCRIEPMTVETHANACRLADRYQLPWYDALIASSALLAHCTTLYSEDFRAGQLIDDRLKVINPFMS